MFVSELNSGSRKTFRLYPGFHLAGGGEHPNCCLKEQEGPTIIT